MIYMLISTSCPVLKIWNQDIWQIGLVKGLKLHKSLKSFLRERPAWSHITRWPHNHWWMEQLYQLCVFSLLCNCTLLLRVSRENQTRRPCRFLKDSEVSWSSLTQSMLISITRPKKHLHFQEKNIQISIWMCSKKPAHLHFVDICFV